MSERFTQNEMLYAIDMLNTGVSEIEFNAQSDPPIDIDSYNDDNHYYGRLKKISADDDISSITRGSVYYLRDRVNDPESIMHPYIIIQSSYVDKVGRITVLGITSTPSAINMVPIIMDNTISYINPNRVFAYNINDFYQPWARLKGTVANTRPFDIALNLYGMSLGMNLAKSDDEIITEYIEYINEFSERSKNVSAYQPKTIAVNKINKLELHVSFNNTNNINPNIISIGSSDISDEQTLDEPIPEYQSSINTSSSGDDNPKKHARKPKISQERLDKAISLYDSGKLTIDQIADTVGISKSSLYNEITRRNKSGEAHTKKNKNKRPVIIIDVNDETILNALRKMETGSATFKLPRTIKNMTDLDKAIFLAADFLYGPSYTSTVYGSSYQTVLKRKDQILEVCDVEYK